MAVRKNVDVERRNVTSAKHFSAYEDAELESDEDLRVRRTVTGMILKQVAKKWAKGILAALTAVAGAFLCTWDSRPEGFVYWSIHIAGLVVFCFGLAYSVEFIKLLLSGTLPKATIELMKRLEIREWLKVFVALIAIGAGTSLILKSRDIAYYVPEWIPYCLGIVSIAGGLTYFWTRSRLYKD